MLRKFISLILVALSIATCLTGAFAATPTIKQTKYEGNGYVDVDFQRDVQYSNVIVSVMDANGNAYEATIVERDEDDLTFRVNDPLAGLSYTYTISGVRSGREGSYAEVNGAFEIPDIGKVSIVAMDYDRGDRELEIEFTGKVSYRDLIVTVESASGESYAAKLVEKDNDSVEVRVAKLPSGTYTVIVSGVAAKGSDDYSELTGSFNVR